MMKLFKVQLFLIDLIESLARHLPSPTRGSLESINAKWRERVNAQIVQEMTRVAKEIHGLRKQISQMQVSARKSKNRRRD